MAAPQLEKREVARRVKVIRESQTDGEAAAALDLSLGSIRWMRNKYSIHAARGIGRPRKPKPEVAEIPLVKQDSAFSAACTILRMQQKGTRWNLILVADDDRAITALGKRAAIAFRAKVASE